MPTFTDAEKHVLCSYEHQYCACWQQGKTGASACCGGPVRLFGVALPSSPPCPRGPPPPPPPPPPGLDGPPSPWFCEAFLPPWFWFCPPPGLVGAVPVPWVPVSVAVTVAVWVPNMAFVLDGGAQNVTRACKEGGSWRGGGNCSKFGCVNSCACNTDYFLCKCISVSILGRNGGPLRVVDFVIIVLVMLHYRRRQ